MEIEATLAKKLRVEDVRLLAFDQKNFPLLLNLTSHHDRRIASNAAWALTLIPKDEAARLVAQDSERLVDIAISTNDHTLRRLLLTLLCLHDFKKDQLRTDFIDFCMETAVSPDEKPGTQVAAMKLAFKQCRNYPELLEELRLLLISTDNLITSPAFENCKKKILQKILKQQKQ